ncbi:MAG: lytic transglycosylase domain-containing protein [Steroidobacteraceae bacterium]
MRLGTIIWLAAACWLGATSASASDIFYYVDAKGTAHYSNVPTESRYELILKAAPEYSKAGERISPRMLARASQYDEIIERAADSADVAAELLRAVIVVESGFNPNAVSPKGARGLMQLMPATARTLGVRDPHDPAQNVDAGARYLRRLMDRFGNDLQLALAAYNAGTAAVERYGKRIPPYRETREYVPKVLDLYNKLRGLTESG